MKQSEYLALHETVEEINPKTGKKRKVLRYRGPYYPVDFAHLQQIRPRIWLWMALCLVFFIIAGCVPALGQHTLYVLLFYVVSLLPLLWGMLAAWRIQSIRGDKIDEMQHQEGVLSLQRCAVGIAGLSAAWVVGEIVLLFVQGVVVNTEWVFLACGVAQTVAAVLLHKTAQTIHVGPADFPPQAEESPDEASTADAEALSAPADKEGD